MRWDRAQDLFVFNLIKRVCDCSCSYDVSLESAGLTEWVSGFLEDENRKLFFLMEI